MTTQPTSTPIVPTGDVFPRITWIRAIEQDPRITAGVLDLAKVMGIGADRYGRCNLTISQIQQRLVLRQSDGGYVPARTIKAWRTKLKKLGVVNDIAPAVGAGFAGPGKGRGGVWQLVLNGQSEALETGNKTGNGVARSTSTPTSTPSPHPKGGEEVVGSSIGDEESFVAKATPTFETGSGGDYLVALERSEDFGASSRRAKIGERDVLDALPWVRDEVRGPMHLIGGDLAAAPSSSSVCEVALPWVAELDAEEPMTRERLAGA